MTYFAALEKQANAGRLIGTGLKALWNKGAWNSLSRAAGKGIARGGRIGAVSKYVQPVANVMEGKLGKGLGLYGMAGMVSPLAGVDLPGSDLAFNIGMPIIGSMNTAANLITARRAASESGKASIMKDLEAGASRAAQDYISGVHVNPLVARDADAYRQFAEQIGHGMKGADTYATGGYKPLQGFGYLQSLFGNPHDLIQNQVRMNVQQRLPEMLRKSAGIGAIAGNLLKGLAVGGATLGLGSAIFSKKPYDETTIQNEGYSAAQAAIQDRLKNMSSIERLAARWDPTLAASAIGHKFPSALKQWESQYGPLQRGMLASTVDAFKNPGPARFYSIDAIGNRNYIPQSETT